jgi:uncharacterized protein (DUF1697 family)
MKLVALLRGINVGGHRKVPMAALTAAVTEGGFRNPRTYIQSGNLVLESGKLKPEQASARLEAIILETFKFEVPVIVRTAAQWKKYLSGPFKSSLDARPHLVHLGLAKVSCPKTMVADLARYATKGEQIQVVGDGVWIDFIEGVAGSKLTPAVLDRAAGSPVTFRNWNTIQKLAMMLAEE